MDMRPLSLVPTWFHAVPRTAAGSRRGRYLWAAPGPWHLLRLRLPPSRRASTAFSAHPLIRGGHGKEPLLPVSFSSQGREEGRKVKPPGLFTSSGPGGLPNSAGVRTGASGGTGGNGHNYHSRLPSPGRALPSPFIYFSDGRTRAARVRHPGHSSRGSFPLLGGPGTALGRPARPPRPRTGASIPRLLRAAGLPLRPPASHNLRTPRVHSVPRVQPFWKATWSCAPKLHIPSAHWNMEYFKEIEERGKGPARTEVFIAVFCMLAKTKAVPISREMAGSIGHINE
ncbi:uncharacterized protein [Notamacropus eugenii]|uniref:uncharacterized protein n=1 Tax=Notamacropus eugenii TaxID=9315 RepID=UPI003B683FA2